jgi:tetratricopeptide (TPR) repeat protein
MTNGLLNGNSNNTMKNIFYYLSLILLSHPFNSQSQGTGNYGENPDACKKNLSIMLTYYKQKAYDDAARSFRKCLFECPESSKNVYIVGEKVMKHFIKRNSKNKEVKSLYVDSLLMIYDLRLKNFPGTEKSQMKVLENKGKILAQYRINQSLEKAYNLLDSVISYNGTKTKASTASRFMQTTKLMNKRNKLDCSEVITNYLKVNQIINANIEEPKTKKSYSSLKIKSIAYANSCLECDLLDSLYAFDFQKNQEDTTWLDEGINLLSDKKCKSSEVLVKMMEKRFDSAPAAKTAIALAGYYEGKAENSKAGEFYNKAIELQKDSLKLEKYLVKKGKFQNRIGNYSGARSTAKKVLDLNPSNAKALIIIGDAIGYGAGNCKDLKFGGAEVFWVAVNYYNKAARIAEDPEIKASAQKKIAQNSSYFPAKNAIFLKSLNIGDSYQVGCWVNASTTIREKQ